MKRYFVVFFLGIFYFASVFAKEVAITIDDFPLRCCVGDIEKLKKENDKFLETLKDFDVPIVAFVNEFGLYNKHKDMMIEMLDDYVKNGHEIGNHTYSHKIINNVGFEIFKKDFERGEKISSEIMKDHGLRLKYFRHPGLGNGRNITQRGKLNDYLKEREYIVAPVTIDTMDWKFNRDYRTAKMKNNTKMMEKIVADYLDYIGKTIKFSESVTGCLFNREIKHVLLMHAIQINIDHLPEVLQKIKDSGYTFITLDEALKDDVYTIDVLSKYGAGNWLSRWVGTLKICSDTLVDDPDRDIKRYFNYYIEQPAP